MLLVSFYFLLLLFFFLPSSLSFSSFIDREPAQTGRNLFLSTFSSFYFLLLPLFLLLSWMKKLCRQKEILISLHFYFLLLLFFILPSSLSFSSFIDREPAQTGRNSYFSSLLLSPDSSSSFFFFFSIRQWKTRTQPEIPLWIDWRRFCRSRVENATSATGDVRSAIRVAGASFSG